MVDINEYVEESTFKDSVVLNISGNNIKLVTDKRDILFGEVPKKGIDEPEEFEEDIIKSREEFKDAEYICKIRYDDYYLYEIEV